MVNTEESIFVFGSNLAGRHGAGAAKTAKLQFGAKVGVGEGRTGNSYAIPTKGLNLEILSLATIERYISHFIHYANIHPELTFNITRVGCGFAGYSDSDIAPLFKKVPKNCKLPQEWIDYNDKY